MAFDNLREQIKDQFLELKSKVEESPHYQNFKEKFETLSANQQRAAIGITISLIVFILLLIPFSYYTSSSGYVESFEANRQLLRRLLRASRAASETAAVPQGMTADELRSRVQGELQTMTLTPEQMGGVTDVPDDSPVPARDVRQSTVGVTLKKLNLKQIVDIGHRLQNLNPGTKLMGLEVAASSDDDHYFDVIYKLTTFTLAAAPEEKPQTAGRGGRPAPRARPGGSAQEEDEE